MMISLAGGPLAWIGVWRLRACRRAAGLGPRRSKRRQDARFGRREICFCVDLGFNLTQAQLDDFRQAVLERKQALG